MKTFGFAGWSGSGKTTLVEKLIPRFVQRGLRVSLVKHAHHNFDVDTPGKDSWRHRQAGASEILVTSSRRWVLMHELRGAQEPSFDEQVKRVSPCDLLLVEGFKFAPIAKLEVWRKETGEALLHPNDPHIVAIATDTRVETRLPQLDLNDDAAIARFILGHLKLDE
jgi:molybdopterin-guanine dinucleotide biosynthesis adapter protein